MTRHSNSLFISVVLHIFILAVLVVSYKQFLSKSLSLHVNEQKRCLQLQSLVQNHTQRETLQQKVHTTIAKKNIQKKRTKSLIATKKITEKKVVNKKIPIKKAPRHKASKTITKNATVEKPKAKVLQKSQKKVQKKVLTPKLNNSSSLSKTVSPPVMLQEKKPSAQKLYMDKNLAKIVALLQENLYYPRRARKRGIQGDIIVRFRLSKDAKVHDIEIISSKSEVLSRGAIKTIENLSTYFPKPQEELTLKVPIAYRLK